jgi:hypothetical protein
MMPAISPKEYLGFAPGDDRKLASWDEITGYLRKLTGGARRIRWVDIGESTEGRPFFYLTIASPRTLAHLDEYRETQSRLADQRGADEKEIEAFTAKAKTIVLLTNSIHATEVGGSQMSVQLAYELETREDEKIKEILDNVILLLVPSLNPDGLDMVVDWYRQTVGTPYEGTPPPFIYQKYAGHDNNRDWFMLNLVENHLTVEKIHNVWHPHIVYDTHQMGDLGFRLFLPPFMDPYDPNVDFILRQEVAELGVHMAGEVLSGGKTGVSWLNTYDAFAPSRAYQHYHGGVRILSEAASVRIASPTTRMKEELRPTRDGLDPKEATWNHPVPWPGGEWHLSDIVECDRLAAFGCLSHAARNRELWVENFQKLSKRATERKDLYAFVFPAEQRDPVSLYELLNVLSHGMVEIHKATAPFELEGVVYGKGSYVVKLAQPYGAYAKTLLEVQRYPDLRQYPGGPPRLPYDVTGHTLPLTMGVKVSLARRPFEAALEKVEKLEKPEGGITRAAAEVGGQETGEWLAISPSTNASAKVVNELLGKGFGVSRTAVAFRDGENIVAAGTFLVHESQSCAVEESCRKHGVTAWRLGILKSPRLLLKKPRVGIYKSYRGVADEGWSRYVLEEYGFPYESVTNQKIRRGNFRSEFDTIIFPSQPAAFIAEGNRPGTYPPEYCGGLGPEGKDAVAGFIEQGGTALFVDAASGWAVSQLGLGATNVVADRKQQEFFCPGSILKSIIDTEHPLGFGLPRELPVAFEMSPAWDADLGTVVARYPATDPLLSGWLLGGQHILNKAALVEFPIGEGRAVLIGFRPYFRGQARGTYRIVFNAIYLGSSERV